MNLIPERVILLKILQLIIEKMNSVMKNMNHFWLRVHYIFSIYLWVKSINFVKLYYQLYLYHFGTLILSIILCVTGKCKGSGSTSDFGCLFYVLYMIAVILSIIFAIILVHYYTKGNYRDFYEFYRCRYLSQKFRKDYSFVFDVETGYQTPMALIIITEFFNFIKLIAEFGPDVDLNEAFKS